MEQAKTVAAPATTKKKRKPKMAYIVIQKGGTDDELYVHSHTSLDDAEQDRIDCKAGGFRTSEIFEVPEKLANKPGFYEIVEDLLVASHNLSYPDA